MHADRTNRVVLALFGLLVLAAGFLTGKLGGSIDLLRNLS